MRQKSKCVQCPNLVLKIVSNNLQDDGADEHEISSTSDRMEAMETRLTHIEALLREVLAAIESPKSNTITVQDGGGYEGADREKILKRNMNVISGKSLFDRMRSYLMVSLFFVAMILLMHNSSYHGSNNMQDFIIYNCSQ
jgi:hypothetical protein